MSNAKHECTTTTSNSNKMTSSQNINRQMKQRHQLKSTSTLKMPTSRLSPPSVQTTLTTPRFKSPQHLKLKLLRIAYSPLILTIVIFILTTTTPSSSTVLANVTTCPPGLQGPLCDQDINECTRKPSVCQNGATCLNKFGGYQCICVNGWTGTDCSENVDDCSTAACSAGATCRDGIGTFHCECPPGKTGILCQFDDGCFNNPCHPNATCDTLPMDGRALCTCPAGYSGQHCEIDNDECANGSPCEHGGVCINTPGSFRCDCPPGFAGGRCEININECDTNPCRNEGSCLDEKGGYRCMCQPGFTGVNCEINIDECARNPCQNGAECRDQINSFRCYCQKGYWGERCEHSTIHPTPPPPMPGLGFLECELKECSAKRFNKVCDQECNSLNCSFDGGDCLLGQVGNPWHRCPNPITCWQQFRDGKCDEECNNEMCLFDGLDCRPQMTNHTGLASIPSINSKTICENSDQCLEDYANGVCDQECNYSACGWDGGDCEAESNGIMSSNSLGLLAITIDPPLELDSSSRSIKLNRLLRNISINTQTFFKIQSIRQLDRATEISLILDNRKCKDSCYTTIEQIVSALNALRVKEQGMLVGLKSLDVQKRVTEFEQSASALYVMACGSLVAVCAVVTVISIGSKRRVKEKVRTVWFPEGFSTILSSRNQDPVDRKPGRGVSTLQALGGSFFRGIKRNQKSVSGDPERFHSTDIDGVSGATPSGGPIYHVPYDNYDQYGTYGTDGGSIVANNIDEPMTPPPLPISPINLEGPDGFTPLMVATLRAPSSKPLGLVNYGTTGEINGSSDNEITDLLNRGAQATPASRSTGERALHLAARMKRVDAARNILDRCKPEEVINLQDATGRTPLHAAIAANSLGVFEILVRSRAADLDAQTHDGTTPLIQAVKVNAYSMLEELILNECKVTLSDADGKTALHWAAATGNVDMIRRLLEVSETNKDAQDLAEETPLFLAAREGSKNAVEMLLNHNANKDISDQMDRTPRDIAKMNNHTDIVRLLEEHEPHTPRSVDNIGPPQASSYHTHSQSVGRVIGRQAQQTPLVRSTSTKPLAEAKIVRNCAAAAGYAVMPATPNSLTNSPFSSSMMSPPTSSSHCSHGQAPPPAYDDCQAFWTNNNNSNINNNNNQIMVNVKGKNERTHGISEVYNIPFLKHYMTPSPDSPFSLESSVASRAESDVALDYRGYSQIDAT